MNELMASRRRILTGMGAVVGLPWLESMAAAVAPASPPKRMAFLYVPNGVHMPDWRPGSPGALTTLPPILQPLEKLRDNMVVLTGLTADKARAHGDGGGDHARALAAFLTGCQARKTDGTDIRAGVSVDQLAASRIGHLTRLGSLEIGAEAGSMAGNCDSGYSCVYSSTMSWKSATQPLPKDVDPRLIFDRLFGQSDDPKRKDRDRLRRSVLDHVLAESKSLAGDLPPPTAASSTNTSIRCARSRSASPAPRSCRRPPSPSSDAPPACRPACPSTSSCFPTCSCSPSRPTAPASPPS